MQQFHFAQLSSQEFFSTNHEVNGWLSAYNRRHNFSSSWRLKDILPLVEPHYENLNSISEKLRIEMLKIFHQPTVDEYLSHYVEPDVVKLRNMIEDGKRIMEMKFFPAREFKIVAV